MTISEPRLLSLLRQAERVAASGKRTAAEKLYRQIAEEAPDAEEAWLGIAALAGDSETKIDAYSRVLEIAPENEEAQAGLTRLQLGSQEEAPVVELDITDSEDPFEQSRGWLEQATSREVVHSKNSIEEASTTPSDGLLFDPEQHGDDGDPGRSGDQGSHEEESYELLCYRHPGRETSLRCYSCGRPICSDCAVKTPVGYRCPSCIREAEEVFYTARTLDYLVAPLVSLPLSLVAGYLVLRFGSGFGFFFIFIMLMVGGAIGGLIGRASKRAVGRRRGRYLPQIVAATVVLGVALPVMLLLALGLRLSLGALLLPGIYSIVAMGAAYEQIK